MRKALRALALLSLGCSAAVRCRLRTPRLFRRSCRRSTGGSAKSSGIPTLKGVDWGAAVARRRRRADPGADAEGPGRDLRSAALATLSDSHTFRVPPGFPERGWATAGLRIGRDGDGYAVKGVLPGSSAEREGLQDRRPRALGRRQVVRVASAPTSATSSSSSKALAGSSVAVTWKPASSAGRGRSDLKREPETAGDALVWKSARVIERGQEDLGLPAPLGDQRRDRARGRGPAARPRRGRASAARAAQLGSDRGAASRRPRQQRGIRPEHPDDVPARAWSAGDYAVITREGRRIVPPTYQRLPVALLVNSGTASAGEALALKFRTHRIGPIVGEETAGMASGGAAAGRLSDGSTLWLSRRAIEDLEGNSYEGRGITPDVTLPDGRPRVPRRRRRDRGGGDPRARRTRGQVLK